MGWYDRDHIMPAWQYWRVVMKGARKAHLTPFVPGQDSGTVALCSKRLEGIKTATTIATPKGDECQKCRIVSGHFKKQKLTKEQLLDIQRCRAWDKVIQILSELGLNDEQKKEAIETMLKAAHLSKRLA